MAAIDNGRILLLVALVVLPIAAVAIAGSGKALKQLGKGRLGARSRNRLEHGRPAARGGPPAGCRP